jgi:hypothetical protein
LEVQNGVWKCKVTFRRQEKKNLNRWHNKKYIQMGANT